ncbi:MAG: winged helix DNA-binding domain-containing protein [Chloroflexia bacterium]
MTNSTTGLPRMTWAEVCARRLERHGLAEPIKEARPAEVVGTMCGAHAQVMSAAELSIGLRIAGATREDVRGALWSERSLVKTCGPRGTVHLLPTQDLPMWTAALSTIPSTRNVQGKNALLTAEQTEEVVAAIADALEDAELTVDELTEAIVERTGSWAGEPAMPAFQEMWPRWRWAEGTATNRGEMCFGPNRGRKVTYTSPRRWLPGFRPAEGHTAIADLLKRYLHAYGPAMPEHFARWLAAPPRWSKELFASLAGDLQQVEVEGSVAWVVAGDTATPSTPPNGVRLLPYFDAYVVGCHPRDLLFPGMAAVRALTHGQAGNLPVLLIDGIVAGIWHQRRSGRKLEITVEPFERLTPTQRRELDSQVERVGEFLEEMPRLTIGTVTVGAHA